MKNNKLQLDEDKTDMMFISPRKVLNNEPFPSEIRLIGTNIKLSQAVRNLDVTLDQTLSFQQHILIHFISESAQCVPTSLKMPQKL